MVKQLTSLDVKYTKICFIKLNFHFLGLPKFETKTKQDSLCKNLGYQIYIFLTIHRRGGRNFIKLLQQCFFVSNTYRVIMPNWACPNAMLSYLIGATFNRVTGFWGVKTILIRVFMLLVSAIIYCIMFFQNIGNEIPVYQSLQS